MENKKILRKEFMSHFFSNFALHIATLAAVIKLRIIRASTTNEQISKSPSSHHIKGF
jgi:hypothetical protein